MMVDNKTGVYYGFSDELNDLDSRLDNLENKTVVVAWYETINSGTAGTLSPPAGGTIELDEFASGVDALASTIENSQPSWETPRDSSDQLITATIDGSGNWTLSTAPSSYPVALIYTYSIKLVDFDSDFSLGETELKPDHILEEIIHFIDEGPGKGYLSGAYKETLPSGAVFPTSVIWWDSVAKTKKIIEKAITYTGVLPTTIQWDLYDSTGAVIIESISDAISYSGPFETSRTRTIT